MATAQLAAEAEPSAAARARTTKETFLAVLTGDKASVQGKGNGKVLESTSSDHVFLAYFDHGATGLVGMPNGAYLYADELLNAFKTMQSKGMYAQLTVYMEACESGSMFQSLPENTKVYAVSAANPTESSWGTYCPPDDTVQGKHVGSCLGDLFSVNWLEDADSDDLTKESLEQQFNKVKTETTKSHVMQWGDQSFTSEAASEFIGSDTVGPLRGANVATIEDVELRQRSAVDSRDVMLNMLYHQYLNAPAGARQQEAAALQAELDDRERWDAVFVKLELLVRGPRMIVVNRSQPRFFDCQREAIEAIEARCGRLSDYALKHVYRVVDMCTMEGGATARIMENLAKVC